MQTVTATTTTTPLKQMCKRDRENKYKKVKRMIVKNDNGQLFVRIISCNKIPKWKLPFCSCISCRVQVFTSYHFIWSTIHVSQRKKYRKTDILLIERAHVFIRLSMQTHTCITRTRSDTRTNQPCAYLVSYCSIPIFCNTKISHFIYFYCFLHFDYELSVHSPELIISNVFSTACS